MGGAGDFGRRRPSTVGKAPRDTLPVMMAFFEEIIQEIEGASRVLAKWRDRQAGSEPSLLVPKTRSRYAARSRSYS